MTDEEFKNEFFKIFPSVKEGKRPISCEEWKKGKHKAFELISNEIERRFKEGEDSDSTGI
jgi:hypothetical protein